MNTKDEAILELRGGAIGMINENSSAEERFQNSTLRPILKFQKDFFVEVFKNYAVKQKGVFFTLSPEKKMSYIENVIQRDIKFRNSLKGIIGKDKNYRKSKISWLSENWIYDRLNSYLMGRRLFP